MVKTPKKPSEDEVLKQMLRTPPTLHKSGEVLPGYDHRKQAAPKQPQPKGGHKSGGLEPDVVDGSQ